MTNLIEVKTNKEIKNIISVSSDIGLTIYDFKLAQKCFQGLLTEPELDRLSGSLAPTGEISHFPDKVNQLVASVEFWEHLMFLAPKIKRFINMWNFEKKEKMWVGIYKEKVISLKKSESVVIESIPVNITSEGKLIVTEPEPQTENTLEVVEVEIPPTTDDLVKFDALDNFDSSAKEVQTENLKVKIKQADESDMFKGMKEFKGYYYAKLPNRKNYTIKNSKGTIISEDIGNVLQVKKFIGSQV